MPQVIEQYSSARVANCEILTSRREIDRGDVPKWCARRRPVGKRSEGLRMNLQRKGGMGVSHDRMITLVIVIMGLGLGGGVG